jgi:hypothetical protein
MKVAQNRIIPMRTGQSLCGCAEALCGAGFRFCGFFVAVLWWRGGLERTHQPHRCRGDIVDGGEERFFVCFGWFVESGDLSHELQRRRANLVIGNRRIEVEQSFDISAHRLHSFLLAEFHLTPLYVQFGAGLVSMWQHFATASTEQQFALHVRAFEIIAESPYPLV